MVDDPAHYRWSSNRSNARGQADARLTQHPLYLALGRGNAERQAACRAIFGPELDSAAIDGIPLALVQNQPIGNERFLTRIENMPGIRREMKPRGRPKRKADAIVPRFRVPSKPRKPSIHAGCSVIMARNLPTRFHEDPIIFRARFASSFNCTDHK